MKAVILAGGMGTRLSEETDVVPKPMVDIGGRPILWHIMKHLSCYGITEFIIALGYKGHIIKEFFLNYNRLNSDFTVHLQTGAVAQRTQCDEEWTVHLVDTGPQTMTGGRLKRLTEKLCGATFLMTYGDGVASIDVTRLAAFHRQHGRLATVTAVRPPARFGALEFDGDTVTSFNEKPQTGAGWINGGYFILNPRALEYIDGDATSWEREPVDRLASEGQMMAWKHHDFWQCMDTVRELNLLRSLWDTGKAPWKAWD